MIPALKNSICPYILYPVSGSQNSTRRNDHRRLSTVHFWGFSFLQMKKRRIVFSLNLLKSEQIMPISITTWKEHWEMITLLVTCSGGLLQEMAHFVISQRVEPHRKKSRGNRRDNQQYTILFNPHKNHVRYVKRKLLYYEEKEAKVQKN